MNNPELDEIMRKFPETYQIVEMLKHFRKQHEIKVENERINFFADDRLPPSSFRPSENVITEEDIKNYIYETEGLKL